MNIEKKLVDGIWQIVVAGDIDINSSAELTKKIKTLEDIKNNDVSIDLKDVAFMDSTGLGALINIFKFMAANSRKASLKNVSPNIQRLIQITNLDKFLITEEV